MLQNCHISYGLDPKKGQICVAWVWNGEGTEKLVIVSNIPFGSYQPE